jgi:hypothetical protein
MLNQLFAIRELKPARIQFKCNAVNMPQRGCTFDKIHAPMATVNIYAKGKRCYLYMQQYRSEDAEAKESHTGVEANAE